MPAVKSINIADLFCGAGGTSSGAVEAILALGGAPRLTAVNHWPVAIDTHTFNHPDARHVCTAIDDVNPRALFRRRELNVLWASPECTHHSNARGGKPVNEQSRATAFCVPRWMDALEPEVVLVENVPEFRKWGPNKNGRAFDAWVQLCLHAGPGYRGEYRVLRAANFGDPTTRERLFVQFVRGRRRIVWPEPTHAEDGAGGLLPWVPARAIIDWSISGESIFERERPLSPKTLARIWAGLEKFGLGLLILSAGGPECPARPVEMPMGTVLTRDHRGLAQPFLICMEHGGSVRSIARPMPVVTTAKGGAIGVVRPFLVQVAHGNGDDPNGNQRRVRSVDRPLPTVCGERGDLALCEPALLPQHQGGALRPVSRPVPTITTDGAIALVEPFLVKFYGTAKAATLDRPLDTVTSKDRFGLARPVVILNGARYLLDIRFRMLQPKELAAAQGFHPGYRFAGNKTEQVKQIGNAVPRNLARALVLAALGQKADVGAWMRRAAA